jgi:hypothetical protein
VIIAIRTTLEETTTTPREASSLWPKELGFRRTHTVE